MLYQVQEMLFIERGGLEQMQDELKAYNPLIPTGKSLVVTLMFEIDNPNIRKKFLNSVGGIEKVLLFSLGKRKFMLELKMTLIEQQKMVKLHQCILHLILTTMKKNYLRKTRD